VRHLSLPHGIKDERIWDLAKEIGYKTICTSDVGFLTSENNGPWLRRITIGDGISEKKFHLITQGKNRATWGMAATKNLKNILRDIVGMRNYRKLYRWMYKLR